MRDNHHSCMTGEMFGQCPTCVVFGIDGSKTVTRLCMCKQTRCSLMCQQFEVYRAYSVGSTVHPVCCDAIRQTLVLGVVEEVLQFFKFFTPTGVPLPEHT